MTKYELMKVTNPDKTIVYFIRKNGEGSVGGSFTMKLDEAEQMLKDFHEGKHSEPIFETIKTIEVDEN